MTIELENREATIRKFEYTSGFHLLTTPRETLADAEVRIVRIERSIITYVDGVKTGEPVPAYHFDVPLEEFSVGLGGVNALENLIDQESIKYKDKKDKAPKDKP